MSRCGWLYVLLAVLFVSVVPVTPSYAAGAERPTFQIREERTKEGHMQVTIEAGQLRDVYAYELNIRYDKLRLKWLRAASGHSGFAIKPIAEGGGIRFAFTRIGKVPGFEGDVELATFTFERIRGGDAAVALESAKLVDSKLVGKVYATDVRAGIADPDGETDVGAELADIHGHWAEPAIREAVDLGFVAGYGDGTFRPQSLVTRAEFVTMLGRALLMQPNPEAAAAFADRSSIPDWAGPWIGAAAQAGLMRGYADGTVRPDRNITRMEAVSLLAQTLVSEPNTEQPLPFADRDQIPEWGRADMAKALEAGLIHGVGGNRMAPSEPATRAQAVQLILSLIRTL